MRIAKSIVQIFSKKVWSRKKDYKRYGIGLEFTATIKIGRVSRTIQNTLQKPVFQFTGKRRTGEAVTVRLARRINSSIKQAKQLSTMGEAGRFFDYGRVNSYESNANVFIFNRGKKKEDWMLGKERYEKKKQYKLIRFETEIMQVRVVRK